MKVYTKTGDEGLTSLIGGQRVKKDHPKIQLYGEFDELNSYTGLLLEHIKQDVNLSTYFEDINGFYSFFESFQISIFDIGALLACSVDQWEQFKLQKPEPKLTEQIENIIDELDKELPKLKNFILPSGDIAACHAHILRTKTRALERKIIGTENIEEEILNLVVPIINRASDLFFVIARAINHHKNREEKIWKQLN
jgi:cob(I)alamin adenosyltransferase